jgi:preprotein translocase subunit SecE
MNLPKQSQNKEENAEQSGKAQKAETLKKNAPKVAKVKKPDASKKAVKKEESGPSVWERFRQYLREVSYELKKVVWPSRKETIGSTSVVVVIVLISALFLGIVDLVLSRLVRLIIE